MRKNTYKTGAPERKKRTVVRLCCVLVQNLSWLWLVWTMYPFFNYAADFAKGLMIASVGMLALGVIVVGVFAELESVDLM